MNPGTSTGEDPRRDAAALLRGALRAADLTLEELWGRYFALGGDRDLLDVEAHLSGLLPLPPADADVVAHAVNERLDELVEDARLPYSRPVRRGRPRSGPLAALLLLLEGGREVPPEQLPALTATAGRAMGVDVTVHVVDDGQRRLIALPVPGDDRPHPPLTVDGSLAGRAFREVQTLSSDAGGRHRLWLPLLDGASRVGVLEVRVGTALDAHDPALRDQCRWLASMVGHLVASLGQFGDALEQRRRTRPHKPSAELLWGILPPLTASSDAFVLSGLVEPAADAGGDAFDYSITADTVSLALFDAMGHGMSAALLAAAAVSAGRSARRDGHGLFHQVGVLDDVVSAQFPGSAFVTGVLAELDVPTGRLRYVNAGHPPPLLVRGAKVVKELDAGRRRPFGLGDGALTVAEEHLQPGDWLALYTDGVTEARDAEGSWFGEERLADLLGRSIAADRPPPETARRLMRAVLDHQGGLLQDDASVLLARWSVPG